MAWDQKLVAFMASNLVAAAVWGQGNLPFTNGVAKGTITHTEINEASGLVTSMGNPGFLWTHNDSGDAARIFLIDGSARLNATYYLEGVVARDWEDIGTMERSGRNYLLVGDIGDNGGHYPYVQLHVVEEPVVASGRDVLTDTIPKEYINTFVLKYEDGPRDAESLFFDPIGNWLYVISKRELRAGIYRTFLPETPTDTLTLKRAGTLPHTFITAADISRDGTEVLMKNLLEVFYWRRRPGESIPQMLKRPATRLPYQPEPQGEAIAFSPDGQGYYTLSEAALGLKAILYFYPRRSND